MIVAVHTLLPLLALALTLLCSALAAAPQFSAGGIVSAASYAGGALAPGEIVTIFGKELGPASAAGMQLTPDGRRVATTLAGTRVLFDGTPSPLLYVSASQLSVVVPCILAGKATTQVQVEYLGVSSAPVAVPVTRVRLGIFTLDSTGLGQGAILNWPDQSVNRPGNAAPRGSVVSLYASSGGWSSPPAEDGRVADQALPLPLPVTATVGGLAAPVLYAGTAPTLVTGVLQVNLRIPADAPLGDGVPVSIAVDGVGSSAGVTLAIRSAPPAAAVTLTSGYVPKAGAFKGQLHCHSNNSDGAQAPAAVVQAYKDAGYHFISITDHNYVTPDPSVPGILFIPGVEQAPRRGHLNRIDVREVLSGSEQGVVDTTVAQGGFVFLNHPNWTGPSGLPGPLHWTNAELEAVRGFHGVEVWNALVAPNSNAEDRIDFLLTRGRRLVVLATDDCHNIRNAPCKTASTWVFADRLNTSELMDNLKSGNFYASSGATISAVSVFGTTIAVTTDRLSTIDFIATAGRVVQTTSRTFAASYTVVGDEVYVRARITRDSDSTQAWSNPIYLER